MKQSDTMFISGIKLNRMFFQKAVSPIIKQFLPGLKYDAGLIGYGSDVLEVDDQTSIDHNWGPRLQIFLSDDDYDPLHSHINELLKNNLPLTFKRYSTHFSEPDWEDNGTQKMQSCETGPINHLIEITTVSNYLSKHSGINPHIPLSMLEWLKIPPQKLLELTSGEIFHSGLNEINSIRTALRYYPDDIWFYLMSREWDEIDKEKAFIGRCEQVEDEIGARIISTRIVERIIRLGFLLERKYIPYSKWFGSLFKQLECYSAWEEVISEILRESSWRDKEKALVKLYTLLAEKHNHTQNLTSVDLKITNYFSRPFQVINADEFSETLKHLISDQELRKLF